MTRRRAVLAKPGPEPWEPTPLPSWQGLLIPVVVSLFAELRLGVALWIAKDQWHPFHIEPNVTTFEYEHGVAARRWAYNHRCLAMAGQKKRIVLGSHAGFRDLFVPVEDAGRVRGILVAGPIATERPTSADVLRRWRDITGSPGSVSDASFSRYLAMTMATLTLGEQELESLRRLMSCLASLVVGRNDPAFTATVESSRRKLILARFAERMWDMMRLMVDERTPRTRDAYSEIAPFGVEHYPEHVVVGLLLGHENEPDPVDDLLRRDAFQRACVALAKKQGGIMCGRLGDHGVAFLVHHTGAISRTSAHLADLAARASALARKFDLELHAGISQAKDPTPLHARYRGALWAAEKALSLGLRLVRSEPSPKRSIEHLRDLRLALGKSVADRPGLLLPRFDRYIEAVVAHSGYRLEPARAHLEAGLERLAEPVLAGGFLDQKSFDDLCASMEHAADDARTVMELVTSYRRLVTQIENCLAKPTVARHDRSVRRAIDFIREHLAEPLTLGQVARVAGFAPDYFSTLFKRDQGIPFARHVQRLRVDRAKHLLVQTALSVEQVQRLCGFESRVYFHRLFKVGVGTTPAKYRARGVNDVTDSRSRRSARQ